MRRSKGLRGTIHLAHEELRFEDSDYFQRFFRMRSDLFDQLVDMVTPFIQRQDTNMRECISPRDRVSVTLRFLTTGEAYRSLEYSMRIPACTISRIVPETCRVIYEVLQKDYLKVNKLNIYELLKLIIKINVMHNFYRHQVQMNNGQKLQVLIFNCGMFQTALAQWMGDI